jgi:hypothetical protein
VNQQDVMSQFSIKDLIAEFFRQYDPVAQDRIWEDHRAKFHGFWSGEVLAGGTEEIPDGRCDEIIRILDRSGKGNTKGSQAIARVQVPQNAWRKLFNSLRSDQKLARLVDAIFKTEDTEQKAAFVDALYVANEGRKNRLTGESATVVNALLAAYDPLKNLSIVSLKDRWLQMQFLGVKPPFEWASASVGKRTAYSNDLLIGESTKLGVNGNARTISRFWYFEPVKKRWKPEDTVKTPDKELTVTVPQKPEVDEETNDDEGELRESLQIQAALAEVGSLMGFQIWLPRADRGRVLTKWNAEPGVLLEHLPVGFDQTTIKTIEQIDVLWVKHRSIVRAFEVEHTTSIYSGLLRMADLLAMQPNLTIKLHIVAPVLRRAKVFQEIQRPVFALLDGGALSKKCTYLSYDSVTELRELPHLSYTLDKVLEDYEETALDPD